MNFTYENQGTNTYLVYAVKEDDAIDNMSLGMITNNTIPGMASAMCVQMDANKYIKYNVSAKIPVSQFFMGPVNKQRLLGVFGGIVDAMLSSEEYMIDTNSILLDLDYIFADVSTCETLLVCLPLINTEIPNVDLGTFFKNIMFSTQFDQTENCDYIAKIMNYLNSTPVFSLTGFKNVIDELKGQVSQITPSAYAVQTPVQMKTEKQPVVQTPVERPKFADQTSAINNPVVTPPVQNNTQISIPQQQNDSLAQDDEKPMSKMYLLQHYSAENAAKYKAQQEAKKNKGDINAPNYQENAGNLQSTDEKPMTKLYLLQHYSAENAAKYKAQQAAKKGKSSPKGNNSAVQPPQNIPRKNSSFAIPGQEAVNPVNSNFQIPQQPMQQRAPQMPQQQPLPVQQRSQQMPQQQPVQQPVQMPQQPQQYVSNQYAATNYAAQSKPMNFGETTVLGGGVVGETTVLSNDMVQGVPQPYLVRAKNNEKIPVNKPVFRIGKEKSYVDYFVSDNTAVSRSHANIITRDGKYFIVDTNSTNHTFIDGKMVPSNTEFEIIHGVNIRLANEDFEFKLY